MTQALRPRTKQRADSGQALASATRRARRTQSVPRTESGRLSQRAIAQKTAEALADYSEGEIAVVADCSKDTAQSWKLGRRAANTAYMITLARSIDAIGLYLAEEANLGRFYGHEGRIKKMLQKYALHETPEGQLARSILRELGAE